MTCTFSPQEPPGPSNYVEPGEAPRTHYEGVRSQWIIENRLHFVRDTTFAEDAFRARTGYGPGCMATLRGFMINTLRATSHANITAGLRETSYDGFRRPLDLLDLS